jgi:two-component system response regulator GlrR
MNEKQFGRKPRILIVDDDPSLLRLLSIRLTSEGYDVSSVETAELAILSVRSNNYDVILSDLRMPGMDGLTMFKQLVQSGKNTPVVLMTAHGTIEDAISATKQGVMGFLTKPIKHAELRALLNKCVQSSMPEQSQSWHCDIITRSPAMKSILEQAYRLAQRDVSILVSGSSGTGKELLANAIHKASPRFDKPFVPINCGAMPENLLESELFGHSKGAFTGAIHDHKGLFQLADGGTLFLDEIGDMPTALQVKLLRALQEQVIRPVGSNTQIKIDVRIISATHRDLNKEMENGNFREDLYYRLNVVNLNIPSLQQRTEDIPILARYLLEKSAAKHNVKVNSFADEAMQTLVSSAWPGNVRQLVNVIEQCVALTQTPIITRHLVDQALSASHQSWPTLAEAKVAFEQDYLIKLLKMTDGNVTRAAELAGRNRTDLHKLMKKYELNSQSFK